MSHRWIVTEPVVVVGNGVSGYACAARLGKHGRPVTMIGPGLPHDRPPLSKRALLTGRLPLLADAPGLVAKGIVHVDGVVSQLDVSARRLTVLPSSGGDPFEVEAPTLVWATGLKYPKPPVPGLAHAEENSNATGLASLVHRLERPGQAVVVVGAGLIGTETAATLAANHRVTLLDMVDRPLARFLPLISDAAAATLAELGVRFVGACAIDEVSFGHGGGVVHTSTHDDIPCDVVISAAGFRSSLPPELAAERPPELALVADEHLAVIGHDDVWACGDCVSFPHPRWGRIAIPHWDNALQSGRHVADAIAGSSDPYIRDPYFFSDIGPLRVQQVGLAAAAVEWGLEDGIVVGRDEAGDPACALLLNAPARLLDARALIGSVSQTAL